MPSKLKKFEISLFKSVPVGAAGQIYLECTDTSSGGSVSRNKVVSRQS